MKKIVFGISLILFSVSLILLGEFGNLLIFGNDVDTFVYAIFSFLGLVISVLGFLEKDK